MEKPVHLFCKALLLVGLTAGTAAPAQDRVEQSQARQKLELLRSRIGDLTTRLADELKRRDQLAARARDADLAIPEKRKALEAVQLQRQAAEKRRAQLAQEQARTQKDLDQQRVELGRQLRASYMIGRERQLQLLLNQQNPSQAGRMLAYYGYFGRLQMAQIQAIERELARMDTLQHEMQAEGEKLAALDQQARRQLQSLLAARNERGLALAALDQRVKTAGQQIAELKQQEQALDSLVANLSRVSPDYDLGPQKPFAQMKGRLPWPVVGRLSARFHQSRGASRESSVRWSGVQIDAARGAKVRAPYFGRVVYADWLQGLGLLMIIEHGAGYLTLYGHSEVLYKNVGDAVAPGDIIAGLNEADATPLYFEIRQGKTPLDPEAWLKSQH
jgi:murein hydrolase activator